MPYFTYKIYDRVYAINLGEYGVIIAVGSPHNKLAQCFVRMDSGRSIWFSRNEIVPEQFHKKHRGEKFGWVKRFFRYR
jgi:hypothetical protein